MFPLAPGSPESPLVARPAIARVSRASQLSFSQVQLGSALQLRLEMRYLKCCSCSAVKVGLRGFTAQYGSMASWPTRPFGCSVRPEAPALHALLTAMCPSLASHQPPEACIALLHTAVCLRKHKPTSRHTQP